MKTQSKPVGEGGSGRQAPGALQWHSEVHRRWGYSTLEFWLLRFHQWYDREETFDQLESLMEELGVGAYTTYELSGPFDVLLRAWIPGRELNGFADNLKEAFPLQDSRQFRVVEIIRHWPWADADSRVPKFCDLEGAIGEVSIEEVEGVNRLSDLGHLGNGEEPHPGDAEALGHLLDLGLVTEPSPTAGIRMFIRLRGKEGLDDEDWSKLTSFTAASLDQLTRGVEASPGEEAFALDDVSLYACNDRSLLILCRIPYHSWHDLRGQLLEPLAARGGVMQTTTLPALSRNFVRSRNRLELIPSVEAGLRDDPDGPEDAGSGSRSWPRPPKVPPGVREYLELPETRKFEAKASAFAPLDPWLQSSGDAPDDDALAESTQYFRKTIAKTVVAMLNSEGGSLLIGVLERDKYAGRRELLERMARLPVAGRYYIVGLQDPEFRKKDWDGFELKFNRLLKESVEGEVSDLVRINHDWFGGRSLALVQVTYPGMTKGFYLCGEGERRHFYVRRGGSSDELHGPKVLEYIERARQREAEAGNHS